MDTSQTWAQSWYPVGCPSQGHQLSQDATAVRAVLLFPHPVAAATAERSTKPGPGARALLQQFLPLHQLHHHSSRARKHTLFVKQEAAEDSIQTQMPICIWGKLATFVAEPFPCGGGAVFLEKASSACLTAIRNAPRSPWPVLPFHWDGELRATWTGIFKATSRIWTLNSH